MKTTATMSEVIRPTADQTVYAVCVGGGCEDDLPGNAKDNVLGIFTTREKAEAYLGDLDVKYAEHMEVYMALYPRARPCENVKAICGIAEINLDDPPAWARPETLRLLKLP